MGFVRFQQLGGEKNTLDLSEWAAPFGRPRKGAIMRDGIEVRRSKTEYAGTDGEPTVHIFGASYEDLVLNGRFRDRDPKGGGNGFAKAKAEEVKDFVLQKQRVRFTWDDNVAIEGLITKFSPGRESSREIEWTMTVEVYKDLFAQRPAKRVDFRKPTDYSNDIIAGMNASVEKVPRDTSLSGDIFGIIDSLVSVVTGAVGQVRAATEQLKSFEKATFGQLNRLTSVISTARTACLNLREFFTSIGPGVALQRETADNNAALWDSQTTAEEEIRNALAEMATVDRAVETAKAGRTKTTYIAIGSDTWESISFQFYGSPSRAGDIIAANGVAGGSVPVAGVTYIIPV